MMDWRIHHTPYVMNLTPLFGSKRLAAWIRPMFPSLIRSSRDNPQPLYLVATLTTYLRLLRRSLSMASRLPPIASRERACSSSRVRTGMSRISFR